MKEVSVIEKFEKVMILLSKAETFATILKKEPALQRKHHIQSDISSQTHL